MLSLISDILLIAAAFGAGAYCFILSRRINRLNGFESGVGGAIAVLSKQVDDMKTALQEAERQAGAASMGLREAVLEAESVADRLEVMMASLHDVSDPDEAVFSPQQENDEERSIPFFHARRASVRGLHNV